MPDRPHIRQPDIGKITQGTIFCCANADRYGGTPVYGLTITARCDVAQDKFRLLNFVPVVRLADWFRRDGLDILLERERKEINGSLRAILKEAGVSPAVLLSVSIDDVGIVHFPKDAIGKAQKTMSQRFWKLVEQMKGLEAATSVDEDTTFRWFLSERSTKVADLIKSLSKHDVLGYYFLERITQGEGDVGYVALLREVTTLRKKVVDELANGLSKERWIAEYSDSAGLSLSFHSEDFAMPISQLESPTVEHIMQCFSNLFARIGIADPATDTILNIINVNTAIGAAQ